MNGHGQKTTGIGKRKNHGRDRKRMSEETYRKSAKARQEEKATEEKDKDI